MNVSNIGSRGRNSCKSLDNIRPFMLNFFNNLADFGKTLQRAMSQNFALSCAVLMSGQLTEFRVTKINFLYSKFYK